MSRPPFRVFLSYAHQDRRFARALRKHLATLERSGAIELWFDGLLKPGDAWDASIRERLEAADLVVLLVTPDFLASSYCQEKELERALARERAGEARVVPVIVRPCQWESASFGQLQALPAGSRPVTRWRNRDAAWLDVVDGLSGLLEPPPLPSEPGATDVAPNDALRNEWRYANLFAIGSRRLPYVRIEGSLKPDHQEHRRVDVVSRLRPDAEYRLPPAFRGDPAPHYNRLERKCRLLRRGVERITPREQSHRLFFEFGPLDYGDYLQSGERLDAPHPYQPDRTLRDEFAPRVDELRDLRESPLTNICGVGVLVVTSDDHIIVSQHSSAVHVWADVWSYSASGTMDWSETVHPFDEVARECREEIGHELDFEHTRLFAVGFDAKKLYVQFSFLERSRRTADVIMRHAEDAPDYDAEMRQLQAIPFTLRDVLAWVNDPGKAWEPSAQVGLLYLCAKEFGLEALEWELDPDYVRRREYHEMSAEWRRRAERAGDLAVMSRRYPPERLASGSEEYVAAVFDFVGCDVDGCDVLEVGCGIGRFTERLAQRARRVTALELSGEMLSRARRRLDALAHKVTFVAGPAQNYEPPPVRHDVALVSQVLIHNVHPRLFDRLVEVLDRSADTLFLFEHADPSQSTGSPHTRIRSEAELTAAFRGFRVERKRWYDLFEDRVLFLKLVRAR